VVPQVSVFVDAERRWSLDVDWMWDRGMTAPQSLPNFPITLVWGLNIGEI
jgi:hypothetical protein